MFQHYAMSTHACIRLLHASPDAPAVDIYANGSPIVQNFAFGQITEYSCVMPGTYRITVYPTGTVAVPIIDTTIAVSVRMNATLALVGFLANISLMVIQEPPIFLTYASSFVRFAHLSPDAPAVDVTGNGTVLFQNIGYGIVTNYTPLIPGSYTVNLRVAGTAQVLLSTPNVALGPGRAYTAFAIGLAAGAPPLQLLVAADANSSKR